MKLLFNDSAFISALYDKCHKEVYKIALSMLGNQHEAMDCFQDVFLLAQDKIYTLKKHPAPDKWLYKTASLTARNMLRKRVRKLKYEETFDRHESKLYYDDYEYTDESQELSGDEIGRILEDNLTPEEWLLYIKRYIERLSISEIACWLELTPSGTATKLFRLRTKIIKLVNNYFNG